MSTATPAVGFYSSPIMPDATGSAPQKLFQIAHTGLTSERQRHLNAGFTGPGNRADRRKCTLDDRKAKPALGDRRHIRGVPLRERDGACGGQLKTWALIENAHGQAMGRKQQFTDN